MSKEPETESEIAFEAFLKERAFEPQYERKRLGRALSREEGLSLVLKLIKEHPDHAQEVMRALVFEHPDADHPLPREMFNGPFDERYGREGDHIAPVFVGDEIKKLRDAGVYPGSSPLFKELSDDNN